MKSQAVFMQVSTFLALLILKNYLINFVFSSFSYKDKETIFYESDF